jgi:hypothetical protein
MEGPSVLSVVDGVNRITPDYVMRIHHITSVVTSLREVALDHKATLDECTHIIQHSVPEFTRCVTKLYGIDAVLRNTLAQENIGKAKTGLPLFLIYLLSYKCFSTGRIATCAPELAREPRVSQL